MFDQAPQLDRGNNSRFCDAECTESGGGSGRRPISGRSKGHCPPARRHDGEQDRRLVDCKEVP